MLGDLTELHSDAPDSAVNTKVARVGSHGRVPGVPRECAGPPDALPYSTGQVDKLPRLQNGKANLTQYGPWAIETARPSSCGTSHWLCRLRSIAEEAAEAATVSDSVLIFLSRSHLCLTQRWTVERLQQ